VAKRRIGGIELSSYRVLSDNMMKVPEGFSVQVSAIKKFK
jgi:hypothetical protein